MNKKKNIPSSGVVGLISKGSSLGEGDEGSSGDCATAGVAGCLSSSFGTTFVATLGCGAFDSLVSFVSFVFETGLGAFLRESLVMASLSKTSYSL